LELSPLVLSLEVATLATLIAAVVGGSLATLLANARFRGRDVVDVIVTAPMVMPPTVLGYYILVAVGHRSPVGRAIEAVFGGPIVFTFAGAVLAATVGAVPLVVKSARASLEEVDRTLVRAARTLGAGAARAFFTVQVPLAARGIVAALMLAFARSLGDFGVTLMVAGDMAGETRTASIAIFDALQEHRDRDALTQSLALTAAAFAILYLVGKLGARSRDAR
jgi:molybdate transport system permease protein